MDILELIPFVQKYPVYVKISAAFALFFVVLTIILMVFIKPQINAENKPNTSVKKDEAEPLKKTKDRLSKNPKQIPSIKQESTFGKNEAIVNTGNNSNIAGSNNSGVIGNGNVVNHIHNHDKSEIKKAETITERYLDSFVEKYPNKNIRIDFEIFGGMDLRGEKDAVRSQIINLLRAKGYTNIINEIKLQTSLPSPQDINITPNLNPQEGGVTIQIPANL